MTITEPIETTATEGDDLLPARIEHGRPTIVSYLPGASEWNTIQAMAEVLSESGLVPTAYFHRPANIVLATLAGRRFGWDPTMAMASFHIIEGQPSLRPEIMLALIRRAGHSVSGTVDINGATVKATRCDNGDTMTATFTVDDAQRAELGHKKVWKQYPADMCWARALSAVGRRLFSDVLLGAGYVPEELGDDDFIDVGTITHTPLAKEADVDLMVGRLNALPLEPVNLRAAAKQDFAITFGLPADLPAHQVGDACELIAKHEALATLAGRQPVAPESPPADEVHDGGDVCATCNRPVGDGPSVKVANHRFHKACVEQPVCADCEEPLGQGGERSVWVGSREFHRSCADEIRRAAVTSG